MNYYELFISSLKEDNFDAYYDADPSLSEIHSFLPQLTRDLHEINNAEEVYTMLSRIEHDLWGAAVRTNMTNWEGGYLGEHYIPLFLKIPMYQDLFLAHADEGSMELNSDILAISFKYTSEPERWNIWADCVCDTHLSGYSPEILSVLKTFVKEMSAKEVWEIIPQFIKQQLAHNLEIPLCV